MRLGIIGCGRILNAHLQGFVQLRELGIKDFEITALCARQRDDALMFLQRGQGPAPRPPVLDPATGDALSAPHTYLSDFQSVADVQIFDDYRELIASGCVDAVLDLTTLHLHHDIGLLALDAGLHLLTQKPLTVSVRTAKALVDRAKQRGLTLGVFENVRQMPNVRAAAWAVRSGQIGTPQFAMMGSLGGLWSPDKAVADTPWRHYKLKAGGGGSIDIGVHQMHWMRYVVGEIAAVQATVRTLEPERYRRDAQGQIIERFAVDVDDTYLATLEFERGALGQLWWSWALSPQAFGPSDAPAVIGSEGSIRGDTLYNAKGESLPLLETFEASISAAEREQYYPMGLRDPYAILQWDWLQSIAAKRDPETSGEEGLRDLACAFAMLESSHAGQRVQVADVLSGTINQYQHDIDDAYPIR
jgi:predicted dehydrogenase